MIFAATRGSDIPSTSHPITKSLWASTVIAGGWVVSCSHAVRTRALRDPTRRRTTGGGCRRNRSGEARRSPGTPSQSGARLARAAAVLESRRGGARRGSLPFQPDAAVRANRRAGPCRPARAVVSLAPPRNSPRNSWSSSRTSSGWAPSRKMAMSPSAGSAKSAINARSSPSRFSNRSKTSAIRPWRFRSTAVADRRAVESRFRRSLGENLSAGGGVESLRANHLLAGCRARLLRFPRERDAKLSVVDVRQCQIASP